MASRKRKAQRKRDFYLTGGKMAQRGRPRQNATLWSSRKRKRRKIKERLNLGASYTEADGTVWRYRPDLIDADHPAPVQVGERIWDDIDAALEAEV